MDRLSCDVYFSAIGLGQSRKAAKQRRLARSARAQYDDEFTGLYRNRRVIEGDAIAVAFRQASRLENGRHTNRRLNQALIASIAETITSTMISIVSTRSNWSRSTLFFSS